MGISAVGIGSGQIADDGAVVVFGDRVIIQGNSTGCFVDVGNRDGEALDGAQAAGVGAGDVQVDVRLGFKVQGLTGSEFELTGDDFKAGIVDGVGMGVAAVRVGGSQIADDGAVVVFGDRGIIQGNGAGRFVEIIEIDGDGSGV